jgi:hypothetical protein
MIATRASALALAAILGLSVAANAQTPPQPPPGAAYGGGGRTWAPRSQLDREARSAERMKALHDALNIRPDQESAFQAFAASMKPEQRGPKADGQTPGGMGYPRQDMAGMTTPERVDAMGRMMDERMAHMKERFQRHAQAVKALYAALGPDQRRTLDALPELMGRGMGMGMGSGRGWRRPDMGPDHSVG